MPSTRPNPLLSDRDVAFHLFEELDAESLTRLPAFAAHSREGFELFLDSCRRFAREQLFPLYRPMDAEPPVLRDGRVRVHPRMGELWRGMTELGLINAMRPEAVGGQGLPVTVFTLASAYLMAGNLSAYGFVGLTAGAAHLIEAFGDAALKDAFMRPMYEGRWTGTMALTEPQAGSSLADVRTTATPAADGTYRIRGSKIFISGGDQDFAENTVHLTLARIDGAPAGTKGISLFAVPSRRPGPDGQLVPNDVNVAGVIHKIGWRGLPSLALNYGEEGDCHGWLVGTAGRGLPQMFQMMNEARLMVGMNACTSASAAYHEALAYAQERTQGRPFTARDPASAPVPLVAHADVRRMLLRQKAIVEGSLSLLGYAALQADLSHHAESEEARARATLLLDLLTPVAKTFPSEKGFEANALSVQVHGGYGYTSEYMPEAWLRDQKLNTIHEGTSGIQSLDLLGRKAVAGGGEALRIYAEEVGRTVERARAAGVEAALCDALAEATDGLLSLTMEVAGRGLAGDVEGMLRHSAHYLDLFSTHAVAWRWLAQAAVAEEALRRGPGATDAAFYEGKRRAAAYWLRTELPRCAPLAQLIRANDDSYAGMPLEAF